MMTVGGSRDKTRILQKIRIKIQNKQEILKIDIKLISGPASRILSIQENIKLFILFITVTVHFRRKD